MTGYVIYPEEITEVILGRIELPGYDCPKQCIRMNGTIDLGSRRTLYFDCIFGQKGDDCQFLTQFLSGAPMPGVMKKRGDKDEIINDLVEAIESSELKVIRIPFRIPVPDENFSPEHIEKFFIAFLGYKTELLNVHDDRFVLSIQKVEERPRSSSLGMLKSNIKKFFFGKE